MNAKSIFIFLGGVLVGLFLGVKLFSGGGGDVTPVTPVPVAQQQPQVDRIKIQGEITQLESLVKEDPGNYDLWKKLGDNYFDIEEPAKSITAYRKALEIDGSDPNVWTDLGIMYRATQDFTKALESFDKALEKNPSHPQSRLNKGVVYVFDLQDYDKGIAAWESYLSVIPSGPQADQVRQMIQQAKVSKAASGGGGLPEGHPSIEGLDTGAGGAAPAEGVQVPPPPADSSNYFPKPEQK